MMMSPCSPSRSGLGQPSRFSSVNSACKVRAPAIAPAMVPRPPKSFAPPSTVAEMADSSCPSPTLVDTPEKPPKRIPAMTADVEEAMNAPMRTRAVGTPDSRAARGLSPRAMSCLPHPVRCSRYPAATATTSRMMTA